MGHDAIFIKYFSAYTVWPGTWIMFKCDPCHNVKSLLLLPLPFTRTGARDAYLSFGNIGRNRLRQE